MLYTYDAGRTIGNESKKGKQQHSKWDVIKLELTNSAESP
jgi:hypothetical protein